MDDGDVLCTKCRTAKRYHSKPCELCGRPPEHHEDGDVELEWVGAARMALARREAGSALSDRDRRALERHPDPRLAGAW